MLEVDIGNKVRESYHKDVHAKFQMSWTHKPRFFLLPLDKIPQEILSSCVVFSIKDAPTKIDMKSNQKIGWKRAHCGYY